MSKKIMSVVIVMMSWSMFGEIAMHEAAWYNQKKVLVTGGCGFIGSHLVEALVRAGAHICVLDNLSTGNIENVSAVQDRVTLIKDSITSLESCLQATHNIDVIFHLAAYISVPGSLEDPIACYQTNVVGTMNILEAARINKVPRVVFASSAAVYGRYEGVCAETNSCNPASPYGYSKWIGELLCAQYRDNYGIDAVALRYFNVYGPRQNPQGSYAAVVAKFSHCMEHNQPIIVCGDGTQVRDFVPVHEIVAANMRCGMGMHHTTHEHLFNIATGRSITLLALIEQLRHNYPQYSQPIIHGPARPGDVHTSIADAARYQAMCGV